MEAETWSEDDRKAILKVGSLFEKYQNRRGKKKEDDKDKDKSFLEMLGIG